MSLRLAPAARRDSFFLRVASFLFINFTIEDLPALLPELQYFWILPCMFSNPYLYTIKDKFHFLFGSQMNTFFGMFFRVRLVIMYPYLQDRRHPQEVPERDLDNSIMLSVFDTHVGPSLH